MERWKRTDLEKVIRMVIEKENREKVKLKVTRMHLDSKKAKQMVIPKVILMETWKEKLRLKD